jgi:hypothetical protein
MELVKVVNCELGTFGADEFVSIEFEAKPILFLGFDDAVVDDHFEFPNESSTRHWLSTNSATSAVPNERISASNCFRISELSFSSNSCSHMKSSNEFYNFRASKGERFSVNLSIVSRSPCDNSNFNLGNA